MHAPASRSGVVPFRLAGLTVGTRRATHRIAKLSAKVSTKHALGFTMVELVMVMMLMGILAAVAVPRLTQKSVLQERGVQDQLRGMLRSSRQLALTQGRDVCVLLLPNRASAVYTVAGACSAAAAVGGLGGEATLAIDLPPGVTLGGAPLVRFNTRGQLVPAADLFISVGSLSLNVSRETGHTL